MSVKRVVFMSRVLTHYRVPFHEAVRSHLADEDIEYQLVYGGGRSDEERKGDLVDLSWGTRVATRYFGPRERLCLQGGLKRLAGADLAIIGHENMLLANYPLLVWRKFGGPRLAFFGHGRGFQAASADSLAERWKRFIATKVDWWFAYTPQGQQAVEKAGFPAERITVFNNSVDTSAITASLTTIEADEFETLRHELVEGSNNVAVYVGGIYANKRIQFLLASAKKIREKVQDFHLVVIGSGADAQLFLDAANEHSWIHYVGPKFGRDKSLHVGLAKVFLMPGLVGLAVLDSFAYGTPMVTTNLTYHSPEIDYLKDGVNGIVVKESDSAQAYADAVVEILSNSDLRLRLQTGAAEAMQIYSIENMARRFAEGVFAALGS